MNSVFNEDGPGEQSNPDANHILENGDEYEHN